MFRTEPRQGLVDALTTCGLGRRTLTGEGGPRRGDADRSCWLLRPRGGSCRGTLGDCRRSTFGIGPDQGSRCFLLPCCCPTPRLEALSSGCVHVRHQSATRSGLRRCTAAHQSPARSPAHVLGGILMPRLQSSAQPVCAGRGPAKRIERRPMPGLGHQMEARHHAQPDPLADTVLARSLGTGETWCSWGTYRGPQ